MPDYEYYCQHCKQPFSAFMHVKEHDERVAECPRCHQTKNVEKRIAMVNVVTSRKS
jgi:putative FmdB family regulatory protein